MTGKKMLAVIGATENIGAALAKHLAASGRYRLLLPSEEPQEIADLKAEIDSGNSGTEILAVNCALEASWEADIIVMATPNKIQREIADKIRDVATGKVIISVSNALSSRDNDKESRRISAAEELQKLLPHSKVVKAFNHFFAVDFLSPPALEVATEFILAGNNGEAVETVSDLLKAAGFDTLIAGDLTASRKLERMPLSLGHFPKRQGSISV